MPLATCDYFIQLPEAVDAATTRDMSRIKGQLTLARITGPVAPAHG